MYKSFINLYKNYPNSQLYSFFILNINSNYLNNIYSKYPRKFKCFPTINLLKLLNNLFKIWLNTKDLVL